MDAISLIYHENQKVDSMKTRPAPLAGQWYPKEPYHYEQFLEGAFRKCRGRGIARGIIVPHAGYLYSGEVAACAYAQFDPGFSGTFITIGPRHHVPLMTTTTPLPWETPFGLVECDRELVTAFHLPINEFADAEYQENSLEMQMPFIKYRFPRARIAPVLMGDQSLDSAHRLADVILAAVRETGRDVRIVASSDLSHFHSEKVARQKDRQAIEAILKLDLQELYTRIGNGTAEACGLGPIATMCLVCQALGAGTTEEISYATSGEVTKDTRSVVGYAAIAVI